MKLISVIDRAKYYAISLHGSQTYGGLPYFYHLEAVVSILEEFGFTDYRYQIVGYLHDVLEDCPVSFNDIKESFGEEIAESVYCITDELGRNRKERKAKTLPKLVTNRVAIIVKLADRIANIRHAGKMFEVYKKEHLAFKDALYSSFKEPGIHSMWNEIEILLNVKQTKYE